MFFCRLICNVGRLFILNPPAGHYEASCTMVMLSAQLCKYKSEVCRTDVYIIAHCTIKSIWPITHGALRSLGFLRTRDTTSTVPSLCLIVEPYSYCVVRYNIDI